MKNFRNKFYLLRHGESESNTKRIIVSNPEVGISKFGLTSKGKTHLINKFREYNVQKSLTNKALIYTSDFLRTVQTAEILAQAIKSNSLYYNTGLRERDFGNFDQSSKEFLARIWHKDEEDSNHTFGNVESPTAALKRITNTINTIDAMHTNETIVIISHGDILQILLATSKGFLPGEHRKITTVKPGDLIKFDKKIGINLDL